MSLFALIAKEAKNQKIEHLISTHYPDENSIQVGSASWLLYEPEKVMPETVHNKLFEKDDNSETFLIIPFDAYWGIQSNTIWNWIGSKGM
jgi:hypothetical protein